MFSLYVVVRTPYFVMVDIAPSLYLTSPPFRLVVPSPCPCSVACIRADDAPYPCSFLPCLTASSSLQEASAAPSHYRDFPIHRTFLSPPLLPLLLSSPFSSRNLISTTPSRATRSQARGPPSAAQPSIFISPQTHINCRAVPLVESSNDVKIIDIIAIAITSRFGFALLGPSY